jgi:hypothetical protein
MKSAFAFASDKKESSVPIDIDKLTEPELVDLNHRIVGRVVNLPTK